MDLATALGLFSGLFLLFYAISISSIMQLNSVAR